MTPEKITKNEVFDFFHPLNQGPARIDINRSWSLGQNLKFGPKIFAF